MREALTILVRQVALVWGTYLVSTGKIDQSMMEPLAGAAMAASSVLWMCYDRFVYPYLEKKRDS